MALQLSQSGRVVYVIAVSQGNVYYATAGATTWTQAINATGDTPPLNFTGVVRSAAMNQIIWFADGVNWVLFDAALGQVGRWAPDAGSLPVDSANNLPRLICVWRSRMVLSGLLLDPQNYFMSAVGDPANFDYAPLNGPIATQAVEGSTGPAGLVGDVITTMIPYTDDILVIGGDHTIYFLDGDPMAGGQIDLISSTIGMAFGTPWAMDPVGNIYFVSNRTGIYTLVPGQQPVRISQGIEQLLQQVNTGTNSITALWDDRFQGCHFFFSPLTAPSATTHFFYDARNQSWYTDQFASPNFDPVTCCVFDGNLPGDRVPLIGSWDGAVRTTATSSLNDDGLPFVSTVLIGPINTPNLDEMLLKDLQIALAETSGSVTYSIYTGSTAEKALSKYSSGATPDATGTWVAGRNLTNLIRRSGHAIYVEITSDNPWAMEQIRARIATTGKVRMRGH
jgi:hypothetical protein